MILRPNLLPLAALALSLAVAGCATETKTTVFVPVVAPTPPSSLTPQPVMLFNQTKDGRKLFTLDAEFPYCDAQTGKLIVVPRWYVTDFASVPWYGQGFGALIQSGWRAYPIKAPAVLAPPPVVVTRTPLDKVKDRLPFIDRKK